MTIVGPPGYWVAGVVSFFNGKVIMWQLRLGECSEGSSNVSLNIKVPFFVGRGALDIIGTQTPIFDPGKMLQEIDAYQMLETLANSLKHTTDEKRKWTREPFLIARANYPARPRTKNIPK